MKKCTICKEYKDSSLFNKDNSRWDGLSAACKECSSTMRKNHYKKNNVAVLRKNKEWKDNNKDRRRETDRNRDVERRATDIQYKLKKNLRARLYSAIKNGQKVGSAIKNLGCSVEELKLHLESMFEPGMSWENWNFEGWHIDHILPLDSFDLNDISQLNKACHYTNLQPLWSEDNFAKSNKVG
jgi:Ni/Co efflux regulator RcnB